MTVLGYRSLPRPHLTHLCWVTQTKNDRPLSVTFLQLRHMCLRLDPLLNGLTSWNVWRRGPQSCHHLGLPQ